MRPLTYTRPKAMLQVGGKPLLWHVLSRLKRAGITKAGIVVKYKGEMIREYFSREENSLGMQLSFIQQGLKHGTGAALLDAEKYADEDFLVAAADNVCDPAIYKKVMEAHKKEGKTIALKQVADATQLGVAQVHEGKIIDFVEKSEKPQSKLANISVYGFGPSIFSELKKISPSPRGEYEVVDVFRGARAVEVSEFWSDVGYPWHLFDLNTKLLFEMEASIEQVENSTIKGKIIMEKGAEIFDSYIEGTAYIGKDTKIGPHSFLRGNNSIGANCHIGESTTIKDSILFDNVNAKHLSYIGDSVVGEGVNFGAGTQIANYRFDASHINIQMENHWVNTGRKKLGAIIGDNTKFGVLACTMPGKMIGNDCWVGSNVNVTRHVKPHTRIFAKQDYVYQSQDDQDKHSG